MATTDGVGGLQKAACVVENPRAVAVRGRDDANVKNQFLEGAYFGITDIASDLSWRPTKHSANVRARSFSVVATGGSFQGWADEGTGWRLDPQFGG